MFGRRGRPCSLYTDRGSHYLVITKAGAKPDPKALTQVGRRWRALPARLERPLRGAGGAAGQRLRSGRRGHPARDPRIEEPRRVGNDNTVVFHRHRLQLPPSPLWAHFVKAQVKVRQYLDGSLAVFHGPRAIGRYTADGALCDTNPAASLRSVASAVDLWTTRRVAHNPPRQQQQRTIHVLHEPDNLTCSLQPCASSLSAMLPRARGDERLTASGD